MWWTFLPFDFSVVLALDVPELWTPHDALVHGAHSQVLVVLFWPTYNTIHGLSVSTLSCNLKGSLTRDFRLQFFSRTSFPLAPSVLGPFWIFTKIREDICNFVFITSSKLFTSVNNTDDSILSPLSFYQRLSLVPGFFVDFMKPLINLSPVTSNNDTGENLSPATTTLVIIYRPTKQNLMTPKVTVEKGQSTCRSDTRCLCTWSRNFSSRQSCWFWSGSTVSFLKKVKKEHY